MKYTIKWTYNNENIFFLGQNGGGGKKWKSRPLYQTQPEVYGKVKRMATSERINLFF